MPGVQKRLGLATIGMTLDIYSHVLPNMQQEAADKMDQALGEGGAWCPSPLVAPNCHSCAHYSSDKHEFNARLTNLVLKKERRMGMLDQGK